MGAVWERSYTELQDFSNRNPSLWKEEVCRVLRDFESDFPDTDHMLQTLHEAQRLRMIHAAHLENSAALKDVVSQDTPPLWNAYTSPPVAEELQERLGRNVYNMTSGDRGVVDLYNGAKAVGRATVQECLDRGNDFRVFFMDSEFLARVLRFADPANVPVLAQVRTADTDRANKIMRLEYPLHTPSMAFVSEQNKKLYGESLNSIGVRTKKGDLDYTLTLIPSEEYAQRDRIPYEPYLRLFFEACDQPSDRIRNAHLPLIERLDAGKQLHITNEDGTDLRVDIEGFTFCNSVTGKNIPGSEVFSGPNREGVDGIIVSKGIFVPPDACDPKAVIRDITLPFRKGGVTDAFKAAEGRYLLAEFLNRAEGNRYCGEIGFGTNAHITHFLKQIGQLKTISNGPMVEKLGGSFHVALGDSYKYTEYEGVSVRVDNGNRGYLGDHWDITTLLVDRNGAIDLDGKPLMRAGRWLGEQFAVLNDGWQAVPRAERPVVWQSYYDKNPTASL